jgi:hypothetical protein
MLYHTRLHLRHSWIDIDVENAQSVSDAARQAIERALKKELLADKSFVTSVDVFTNATDTVATIPADYITLN